MKELYSHLLQMALGVGLIQRDSFVERVSAVLEQKMETSPERGRRFAEELMDMLLAWREQLRWEQMVRGVASSLRSDPHKPHEPNDPHKPHEGADAEPSEAQLEEQLLRLSEAIERLTRVLNRV